MQSKNKHRMVVRLYPFHNTEQGVSVKLGILTALTIKIFVFWNISHVVL